MKNEEWRDVPKLEKFYSVSNTGMVASKNRDGKDGRKRLKGRILKITVHNKTGQTQVCMSVDGVKYKKEVSRIVASAFLGECPEGLEVCHIDCNSQNNHLSNLAHMPPKQKVAKTLGHYCEPETVVKASVTQKLLQEYFRYENGNLIRIKRTGLVAKLGKAAGFRRIRGGETAGQVVRFAKCTLELNRAIFLFHSGTMPDYVLHKDGDFNNCRWENLEACTASEWAKRSNRIKNITESGQ
jgi:hypothetical protein